MVLGDILGRVVPGQVGVGNEDGAQRRVNSHGRGIRQSHRQIHPPLVGQVHTIQFVIYIIDKVQIIPGLA